jgi:hypothetical protein
MRIYVCAQDGLSIGCEEVDLEAFIQISGAQGYRLTERRGWQEGMDDTSLDIMYTTIPSDSNIQPSSHRTRIFGLYILHPLWSAISCSAARMHHFSDHTQALPVLPLRLKLNASFPVSACSIISASAFLALFFGEGFSACSAAALFPAPRL